MLASVLERDRCHAGKCGRRLRERRERVRVFDAFPVTCTPRDPITFCFCSARAVASTLTLSAYPLERFSSVLNPETHCYYCWDALTKIALTLASGCYALGRRMMPELV